MISLLTDREGKPGRTLRAGRDPDPAWGLGALLTLHLTWPGALRLPVVPLIEVSVGELVDRLSILELKCAHLQGEALERGVRERDALAAALEPLLPQISAGLHQELATVNRELWTLEDGVRICERRGDFGAPFVAMARRIYQLNDRRAAIKRAISVSSGSSLIDEKVHGAGGAPQPGTSAA